MVPDEIEGMPVKVISYFAFSDNAYITSVVIPETVCQVESVAFSGCTGLKRVEIKGRRVELGRACFAKCTQLTEFIADYDSLYWGIHVFHGCSKLMSKDEFVIFENGKRLVDVKTPVTKSSVIVPDGVEIINTNAFADIYGGAYETSVSRIKQVILPETVKVIGWDAFRNCKNLQDIYIPSSVILIKSHAFDGCYKLRKITIPESVDLEPEIFGNMLIKSVTVVGKRGGRVEKYIDEYNKKVLNYSKAEKIIFVSENE